MNAEQESYVTICSADASVLVVNAVGSDPEDAAYAITALNAAAYKYTRLCYGDRIVRTAANGQRTLEMVDYIFGGNMSEAFFGKMHPFSPVGGVFYCESALEKVGNFITTQFEQETKKVNRRISRYTKKYAGKGGKK